MFKTKTQFQISWRQIMALVALGLLIVISAVGHSPAQAVVQGYNADSSLSRGTIVVLNPTDANKVQAATSETNERIHGVVVDPNDAAVTLSAPDQKVFVATTGRFSVLVSNQNGAVKPNDYISISSLPGIGMTARSDQSVVLGRVVSGFDGNSNVESTANVNDGKSSKQVAIGTVLADINIIRNPQVTSAKANLPGFLQSASSSIAGKSVNPARVYLAAALLLISGIITGSLLYAGVRSSIVSVGRNPLSRRSIMGSLLQVIMTSLVIFIGGLFGVYLLLKL